ncbi:MAG: cell division ATP-binding protein FtsE [Calditrichia bacterium]
MLVEFVNVAYKINSTSVLDDVTFTIDKGEFFYLKGPNAVGKSTILKMIYMQRKPTSGTVLVGDFNSATIKRRHIPVLRRQIGIIFQDFWLLDDRSVFENVAFALRVQGVSSGDIRRRVIKALYEVGLSEKQDKLPVELSGGDKQRVAIARAIVNDPFILLADEPTANLSVEIAGEIMSILEDINRKGTAVLMATHDDEIVKNFKHKTIFLDQGRITKIIDPFQKEPL